MSIPLVSVIAPCYNGESYIRRFLDSIIAQTYPRIELILINDGSEDQTESIILSYKDKFKKRGIEFIYKYNTNAGIGAAINTGLKLVSGKYFTWIGTDDYCHPEFVRRLVDFMEKNTEYSVVRNDGYIVDEDDNTVILGKMADGNKDKHNPKPFMNAILEVNFNFGYCLIRTSEFIRTNPEKEIYPSRQGQNWQVLLPLLYWGKAAFFDEPLYYVVENKNSVSRDPGKKGLDSWLAQRDEHKRILIETIMRMKIPEQKNLLRIIDIKYHRAKMRAAYNYGDKNLLKKEFHGLISCKKVTLQEFLFYIRGIVKL